MKRQTVRLTPFLCLSLLWITTGCTAPKPGRQAAGPAAPQAATIPWDMAALSETPKYEWASREGPVWSLYYQGPPYQGKPTRVFAYYASPATVNDEPATGAGFPGVVLVHGGGGTAYKTWVELWANRGYAAIAMDLAGCGPDRQRLPDGGPDQSDEVKFGAIDQPPTDQWTYQAVADVILAHSLLRNFEEVDASRTAVTGISWGGYLTCIVAGVDDRFRAAVPVYGCGFLHENSTWLDRFEKMTPQQKDKWVQLWDPSSYLGAATMPMLFVNGTNDFAYPLDSYAKSYGLVKSRHNFRITVNMPHSHRYGWAPIEIGIFIDRCLKDGLPLPRIRRPEIVDGRVWAEVRSRTNVVSAAMHYTTETGPINKRQWETVPCRLDGSSIVGRRLPANATIWFLTVTDERDATISSELMFGPPK